MTPHCENSPQAALTSELRLGSMLVRESRKIGGECLREGSSRVTNDGLTPEKALAPNQPTEMVP